MLKLNTKIALAYVLYDRQSFTRYVTGLTFKTPPAFERACYLTAFLFAPTVGEKGGLCPSPVQAWIFLYFLS